MSFCRVLRVIPIHFILATFLLGATTTPVFVVVSNETVPAGGTVQLKFSLSKPALIAHGGLSIDLDPTMFASVTTATAFSANGDAYGFAQITGLHVVVQFGSLTDGVGQLPGIPMVVVTATILATAIAGQTASVTADPTASFWNDPQGNPYSVSVSPGTVTIGGTLSIANVSPGGGLLASGAVIEIDGTGFGSATTASIDGASVASVQVASPQKMILTLRGPTELTGKRVRVGNPDGSEVDAFPFIPGVPVNNAGAPLDGAIPILPLQTYTGASFFVPPGAPSAGGTAIRNPNPVAVNLVFDTTNAVGYFTSEQSLTVPAGASVFYLSNGAGGPGGDILVLSSAPVQMVQIEMAALANAPAVFPPYAFTPQPLQILADPLALSWVWQQGTAPPSPQSISLALPRNQPDTDVTVSAVTSNGGNWLSVTPTSAHVPGFETCRPGPCVLLQVSANPGSLSPGIYRGTVTITPVATAFRMDVVPAVIPVALTVTASPLTQTIIATRFLNPNSTSDSVIPPPGTFSGPVSMSVVTDSGGNWLSATPSSVSAPASIAIQANPDGLGVGSYTGDVVVTGSGNTLVVPVDLQIEGSPRLVAGAPTTGGTVDSLNFVAQQGAVPLPARVVQVSTEDCNPTECFNVNPDLSSLAATVQTHSGGNWLSASVSQGAVLVNANAAGLRAGVYLGAVTLTASGVASGQVPVVLVVESGPPPALVAGPGLLFFGLAAGASGSTVCVTSESVPINFGLQVSTSDGGGWIEAGGGGTTPACFQVSVDATGLAPGVYSGNIAISGGQQSVSISVKFGVTPGVLAGPPLLGSVASAASEIPAALSPGEIIAIHGQNLGPLAPAGPSVNAQGQFSTRVSGVSVMIGGLPAPILSASQAQVNTVVPYEVAGQSAITVQVQNVNASTGEWSVPSAASVPAIFTLDQTGTGGGAVLNADSSLNSPSNPAVQGTPIQIFATGEGLTNPPGETGSVATGEHQPVLPVGITIGGVQAQVVYEGSAPGEIQGLFQINAIVPNGITPGNAVPILLTVGQAQSHTGVTIAVQ